MLTIKNAERVRQKKKQQGAGMSLFSIFIRETICERYVITILLAVKLSYVTRNSLGPDKLFHYNRSSSQMGLFMKQIIIGLKYVFVRIVYLI